MKIKEIDTIDILLAIIEEMRPDVAVLEKNPARYKDLEDALTVIQKCGLASDDEAEIVVKREELIGTSVGLEIYSNLFAVDDLTEFAKMLTTANTFEVFPLSDGRACLSLGFQNVYKPFYPAPAEKN